MIKNYFNVALRNLQKHKFYSLLNVLGLSIGLACFMLISLFIKDELSYDKFYEDADRIYRINFAATLNGNDINSARTGGLVATVLKNDYPEVEDAIRLRNSTVNLFVKRNSGIETFKEETVILADSNFFDFFSVKLIYGESSTALNRPNTMVMDIETSQKIFGDIDPVGEVLSVNNSTAYEVTGVYEKFPQNSHFHNNMILSMSSFDFTWAHFLSNNFNSYVKFREGTKPEELISKFPEMTETYGGPLIRQFFNMNLKEFRENGNALEFSLTALAAIASGFPK